MNCDLWDSCFIFVIFTVWVLAELVQCTSSGRWGDLIGVCMVCALCGVKERKQAWAVCCQVFLNAPPLGVAYYLTKPGLALMQRQPLRSAVQRQATWLTLLQCQLGHLVTSICFGSHVSAADTLTLLTKASVTVIVHRRLSRTFLPARD